MGAAFCFKKKSLAISGKSVARRKELLIIFAAIACCSSRYMPSR